MGNTFLNIYIMISLTAACLTATLAVLSFKKHNSAGKLLGLTCIFGVLVNLAYLVSVLPLSYRMISAASSVYFICIDWMLLSLSVFVLCFVRHLPTKPSTILLRIGIGYGILEIILFVYNIFDEVAVTYLPRETAFACYSYGMKPLYMGHLIFTYGMVVLVLMMLGYKIIKTPAHYRRQFLFPVAGIVTIVCINAIFLFPLWDNVFTLLDYSILGYGIALALIYWGCFRYARMNMLESLSMLVFDEVNQGLVLFDYEGYLIMHNQKSEQLLGVQLEDYRLKSQDFQNNYGIYVQDPQVDCTIQCYPDFENARELRCDYKCLKDGQGRVLGYLYTFMDLALATDLLTGFYNWDFFKHMIKSDGDHFTHRTGVLVIDMNNLSVINNRYGRDAGDHKIQELAQLMRRCLPKSTNFVRGREAELIALVYQSSERRVKALAEKLLVEFDNSLQYGLSETGMEERGVLDAIAEATKSLTHKKLMNQKSGHSHVLNSLVRALRESDADTEAHVRRTQILGAKLGEKIGLNDVQQSQLALLCMLHDIGKIGIPLEILNKPGRLTSQEWDVLKTHTRKGYEIAMSTPELADIADMVLHHHERWDGRGYPDGLRMEAIPLLSRVISIVDAYDAMIQERSYKKAVPKEVAIQELEACAGSQFDPKLTAAFLEILKAEKSEIAGRLSEAEVLSEQPVREQALAREVEDGYAYPVNYCRYEVDENDFIIAVDRGFEALTGYSADEVAHMKMQQKDLIPPCDRKAYEQLCMQQLNQIAAAFLEHRILCKDSSIVTVYCYGKRFYDSAERKQKAEIIVFEKK